MPRPPALQRRPGLGDAVVIGAGSMVGAWSWTQPAPVAVATGATVLMTGVLVRAATGRRTS